MLGLLAVLPGARLTAQTIPQAVIKGVVTDADTGRPLADTHVFVANTTWGAVTDSDGAYVLDAIPLGTYEVVASRVGYAVALARIKLADTTRHDIALHPTVIQGSELVVSAEPPKVWKQHLKTFEAQFLGTSKNAKKTRLLNPEVLDFKEDEKTGILHATAAAPLQVVNEALGYRIEVILREFKLQGEALRFTTKPRFEPLTPKNGRQRRRWEAAREKAYRGSLRHFLTALAADSLAEEGFQVYGVPRPFLHYPKARAGELRYEQLEEKALDIAPDTLVLEGTQPYERQLRFNDYLQIVYRDEWEAGPYLKAYRMNRGPRDFQTSWIRLAEPTVTFDVLGNLENAYSIIRQGYFFWDARLANMLPLDYGMDRDVVDRP